MAHLFAPQPSNPDLPTFFNVEGVVGAPPAQNLREDVLLVQFAFKVIGRTPRPTTPPDVTTAAKKVQVTGSIEKSIESATINAIRVLQTAVKRKFSGAVVDGRVSPARGRYSYGSAFWSIVVLNESVQERHKAIWPRIDKIPGCPGELRQMVVRTVIGK